MFLTKLILRTWLHPGIRTQQIEQWAAKTNLFFILALGRSGTTFLAKLLNQIENTAVFHEPVQEDFRAYREAFHNPLAANWYIHTFRKKEIYLRMRGNHQFKSYGEVNSALRRHVEALKTAFPQAAFVHLVRDGRDVVRSMMSRRTMRPDDPHTKGIMPPPTDPYYEEWSYMNRFARLCWYWQVENAYLRQHINRTVQFERLITDYEYFNDYFLASCKLDFSFDTWQTMIQVPHNQTLAHDMSAWSEWEPNYQETFNRICQAEMKANGYES